MSGLAPASRISRASSSVSSISSNSTCSFSTEFTSMNIPDKVDFAPSRPFWTLRSTTERDGVASSERKAPEPQTTVGRLSRGRHASQDRLFPRREDVQRVAQEEDCHVRVEPVQFIEGHEQAPVLRKAIRDCDDLREVPHLLEELFPLRDQLVLRKLYEHILPPTQRGGSLGKGHIDLSLPSTDARTVSEFRSDRFHWNPCGSRRITRTARSRTRGIERIRPRERGSRRTRDTSSSALDLRWRQSALGPWMSRA